MNRNPSIALTPKAALLVSLMLAGALAGCVDNDAKECVDGVCTTITKPGDTFLTNATRHSAVLDPCWGVLLVDEFPAGVIASQAPTEFEADGTFPGTERIQLSAMSCQRIVVNDVVADDVHMMFTAAGARPRDDGWSTGYWSVYLFELLVDDPDIARALAELGLPAQEAVFTSDRATVPAGYRHDWWFESDAVSFGFDFVLTTEGQGRGSGQNQLWWGQDPYYRIDDNSTNMAGLNAGLGPSILSIDGDSAFQRMLQTSVLPMAAQGYVEWSHEWIPVNKPFAR